MELRSQARPSVSLSSESRHLTDLPLNFRSSCQHLPAPGVNVALGPQHRSVRARCQIPWN
ncbi:rCG62132 [Rattus norvegicus]|uniref:RCG62132 n=1 Tax=Rattus norvegicus TaxID=10116 RepID=A6HA37_RAT|nr:rCG62132 [Rattus norvegicus]